MISYLEISVLTPKGLDYYRSKASFRGRSERMLQRLSCPPKLKNAVLLAVVVTGLSHQTQSSSSPPPLKRYDLRKTYSCGFC